MHFAPALPCPNAALAPLADQAVQRFKKKFAEADPAISPPPVMDQMVTDALSIIGEYMAVDADMACSLPSSNPFKVRPKREELEPCTTMFDVMATVAFKSLEQDVFMRFCATAAATELLDKDSTFALPVGAAAGAHSVQREDTPPEESEPPAERVQAQYMLAAVVVGVAVLLMAARYFW